MTLLEWVPEKYRAYLKNLPHGARENDFPDTSSTLLEEMDTIMKQIL